MKKIKFYIFGAVLILLLALLYTFAITLKKAKLPPLKVHNRENNEFGVWLWYLHHTGYKKHEELSHALANLGVKRIYVKVANGKDLLKWPELRDKSVHKAYKKFNIDAWAWSYNYPGNEVLQSEALYFAAKSGYKSFVVDIEKEFDGRPDAAEALFKAFYDVRQKAIKQKLIDSTFKIYCTTWGNPKHHNTPIAIINKYVDGFMPQTYVEVWGDAYIDNIPYWINVGNNEYLELGCTKPILHIASTEYDKINHDELNVFLKHAGKEASLWRIPGGGVTQKVWKDWEKVDWDMNFNDSTKKQNYTVFDLDTINKKISVNHLGPFVKLKVVDSTGFITKDVYYKYNNCYYINDLCNEKYYLEIHHMFRKTRHPLDLSKSFLSTTD